MVEGKGIPMIDLKDFPQQSKRLLKACEKWGCFETTNHNISIELMSEMKSVVRSLLDLPVEIKRRNTDVIVGGGYVAPTEKNRLYEALGLYNFGNPDAVEAFCDRLEDSSHQREVIKSYSNALHVFTLGSGAVTWVSRLQKIIALSTTEAEYVAATETCKEMVWLQSFMRELGMEQEDCELFSDSQSAIHLAKNSTFHSRTKHIDIRYHYIRSLLESGCFKLSKIHTSVNPADMLTKAVTVEKLKTCSASVGLQE